MCMSSELERGTNSSRIEVVEGVRYLTLTVPFNPAPAAGKAHLPNARPPTVEREEKTAGQELAAGQPSTLPRRRAHGSAATSVLDAHAGMAPWGVIVLPVSIARGIPPRAR